ncbi:uncharacterized protein LOC143041089 isoform X2 [Oratosquilla oratoria]|uniref:uncharacterized protein LOC143041089 isoform X2 n=1 Tax=Oratosquilla oratoria TaxID=337810 RepID=UPI003F762682
MRRNSKCAAEHYLQQAAYDAIVAPSLNGTGRPSHEAQNVRPSIRHQHAQEARATTTHVSLPLLPGVTSLARGGPLKNEEGKVAKDAQTSSMHSFLRRAALVLLLLLATPQALPNASAAHSYIEPFSISPLQDTLAVRSAALPKSRSMSKTTPTTTRHLVPFPPPRRPPAANQLPLHRKLGGLEGHFKLLVAESSLPCTLAMGSSGVPSDHKQFWVPVVVAGPFAQQHQWGGVQGSRRRPPGQAGGSAASQAAALLLLHCGGGDNTTSFRRDVMNLETTPDSADGSEEEQERATVQREKESEGSPPEQRRKKRALADRDGWTTIGSSRGFGGGKPRPNLPFPPPPSSSSDVLPLPSLHEPIQNDRVWQSKPHRLSSNSLADEHSTDLGVDARLQRLDFYFAHLAVRNEDCRRRILCEVSQDPKSFAPLSTMLLEETSLEKEDRSLRDVTRLLLRTEAGSRLLSYLEAVNRGKNRYRRCDVYRFGCPQEARELLNTDALIVWNEVVRWLTVKVLSKDHGGGF